MTAQERLLINICQSYFRRDRLSVPENTDWTSFFSLARCHNQLGVCQCVLNENRDNPDIPDDARRLFTKAFYDIVFLYELQTNALSEIKEAFTAAELQLIPFKGAYLRTVYPVPEARSMGDTDILVRKSDRAAAAEVMKSLGFELLSSNSTVDEFSRGNVLVEIHTRLTDEFDDEAFDDAFENASFDGYVGTLNDSYHLAYLIAHLAAHFKYRGAGIGLVLDVAIMLREGDIDLARVMNILSKIGLERFGKVIVSLCCELFGYGEKYTDYPERTLSYLVSYGVFGTGNDSLGRSTADDTVSRLREFGAYDGRKRSRFLLYLKMAFPPYSSLRKASYIKFLNGRPYLLPLAWCYRLYHNLVHRRRHIAKTVENIDDENTNALIDTEQKFFEEIGL